jgi:hypothetical protein
MLNVTNIPAPRVDFIDPRTGLMSREWYRFFLNLYTLTGSGSSPSSLDDLQKSTDASTYAANIEVMLDDLRQQLETAPISNTDEIKYILDNLSQKLDSLPQPQLGTMAAVEQDNARFIGYSLEPSPPVGYSPGVTAWSQDDGTLDLGLYDDSILKIGQETLFYAKNTSGSLIPKGTPVMFTGTVGSSGKLTFGLAVADGTVLADFMMGVTSQDVDNNDFGYVTNFGLVRGFNTTGSPYGEIWADGDLLYFGATSPGTWTKVQPLAPRIDVPVAVVVNAGSGGAGSIFVRMTIAESLSRLQDVFINGTGTPTNGDILIYDSADLRWENKAQSTIVAGIANNLSGGAAGSVPYQTAPNTTGMLAIGAANTVLTSNGSAPQWSTGLNLTSASTIDVNSTSPALRITQTGTGNCFVVEDSASPDATPFVIDASGNVGIGTISIEGKLHLNSTGFTGLDIESTRTSGNVGGVRFRNSSSTQVSQIIATVSGDLFIATGGTTERMRIRSDGNIGIGSTGDSTDILSIASNMTGGTTTRGVVAISQVQSDVTANANVIRSEVGLQAASFTLSNLRHFSVAPAAFGAGSSVTNQFGFVATSTLTGAINNYGFYGNIASDTGRWNFYADGTAPNYFEGDVRSGTLVTRFTNFTTQSGTVTYTAISLLQGIRRATPTTAITQTLPTGTNMDAAFQELQISQSFEWSVINLASVEGRTITVAANTGHIVDGNMVVEANSSGRFLTRKTADNSFRTFRIA